MATIKFHISSSGKPVICRASKSPCPLGADSPHFATKGEAESYLEKRSEERAAELEATIENAIKDSTQALEELGFHPKSDNGFSSFYTASSDKWEIEAVISSESGSVTISGGMAYGSTGDYGDGGVKFAKTLNALAEKLPNGAIEFLLDDVKIKGEDRNVTWIYQASEWGARADYYQYSGGRQSSVGKLGRFDASTSAAYAKEIAFIKGFMGEIDSKALHMSCKKAREFAHFSDELDKLFLIEAYNKNGTIFC